MGHQMVMCVQKPKTRQIEGSMFEDTANLFEDLQRQRQILQDKPGSRFRVVDFLTEEAKDNVRNEEIARRMEKTEFAEQVRLEQSDKKKMEEEKVAETLKAKSEKKQVDLEETSKLCQSEEIFKGRSKEENLQNNLKIREEIREDKLLVRQRKMEEMVKSLKMLRLKQEAKMQKEQTDLEHASKLCQTKKIIEEQVEKVELEKGWKMCGEETLKRPKCHQENNDERQNSYIHSYEETCIFAAITLKPTTTSFHNEQHKEPTRMKNVSTFVIPKEDAPTARLQSKKQNVPWCICF